MSRFSAGTEAFRALGRRIRRGRAASVPSPASTPPAAVRPPTDPPAAKPPPPAEAEPRRARLRPRAALGRALAAVGGAFAVVGRRMATVGRGLVDAVRGVGELWLGLDVYVRRWVAIAAAAIAVVLAFVVLAVPALPCQYPGGDTCPPPDAAADLVPADALAYVHLDVDSSTEQYRLAADDLSRVPTLSAQIVGRLLTGVPAIGGSAATFDDTVRPWLGNEAALALLPARRAPQEVELLAVAGPTGARSYQRSFEGAGAQAVTYRGTDIEVGRGGITSAVVRGFLVIGTAAGTRAVIDTATGAKGAPALSDSNAAKEVRRTLPAQRVADAYLSPAGVAAVAGRPNGLLSSLAPFVAPGATTGAAVGLVAGDGSLGLEIRSALDPKRAKARPGFFAAFRPFDPALANDLPASTLAYLGTGEPGEAIASLLSQASTEEPGLARAASAVLRRVRKAAHLALRRDLLPVLGSEGAVALEPAPPPRAKKPPASAKKPQAKGKQAPANGKQSPANGTQSPASAKNPPATGKQPPASAKTPSRLAPLPGLRRQAGASPKPAATGSPYVLYVGGGIDEKEARPALARLSTPIAHALASGGTASGFTSRQVAGVAAQTLSGSPTINLGYTIVGGRLVVATDPAGIAAIAHGDGGLASSAAYEDATAGFPGSPSVLAYLDLSGLVALGEQAGLAQSPAYATFAADIRRLSSLAVSVTAAPDSLATDARLTIASRDGG